MFRIRRALLDDLAAQPQAARIASLGTALLVLHSPIDELVGVDNARRIFAARHPKSFVALDGADHLPRNPDDAELVATVLAAWATRYLPGPAPGRRALATTRHRTGSAGSARAPR